MVWGAVATAAGAYLGAQTSAKSISGANKMNLKIAREQMGFQKHMSSTAHQRQVKDMKTAGLNPILSAGGGGASSPSGALATMQPEVPPATAKMATVDTALAIAQLGKIKAEKTLTQQETENRKQVNVIQSADVASAKNIAEMHRSKAGKYLPWIREGSSVLGLKSLKFKRGRR